MSNFAPNTEGVWHDLPEKTYREAPGENISTLKVAMKSEAHYLAEKQAKKESTAAQILGTCIHTATLQPHLLASTCVVRPDGMDYRSKEGRSWRDSQTTPIITSEDFAVAQACSNSIRAHKAASAILQGAKIEVAVFAIHEETGLLRKARLDLVTTDANNSTTVADIKTCDDASPDGFSRAIGKWDYASQASFYTDIIGASFFCFIAVEKTPPYACAVYCVDAESLQIGRDRNNVCLRRIAQAKKTGIYPAYSDGIEMISAPRWMKAQAATE